MSKPTVEDVMDSISGFDEIAVEKAFGKELLDLSASMVTRALVFVMERKKNGNDNTAAFNVAMNLGMKDLNDQFEEPVRSGDIVTDVEGGEPGKALSADETSAGPTS